MQPLKKLVESSDTWPGRLFDHTIQTLIVVSLVSFSLETIPDLSQVQRSVLSAIEVTTVLVFTAEYIVRLFASEDKQRFVLSFYGIIDLLAILPFYVSSGIDLRSVRAFRLLRLFRTLKLARYSTAVRRFHRALIIVREEIVLFMAVAAIIIYLSAVGIYYFENAAQPEQFSSIFESLWWSVCTLTTVGYGDVYPITTGGRAFTFVVLLFGLGVVTVPAGLFATALSKARELEAGDNADNHPAAPERY